MIHVRSWRTGRSWGRFHLFWGQMRLPLCGLEPPKLASVCELSSSPALQLEQLCRKCLLCFALHEEGASLKEPA
jgi:hypothetical protein